jgi:N-acetylglutamate synthase-like GNAT family acetyltransferase
MRGVQISYLIDYPQHMPQLTEWMFQEWDVMLGQKTPEARIKELNAHMNRDQLPIAWVAHADGRLLGSAALRVHDIEGHEHLTPWLGGVYIGPQFRRRGIGAALCTTVEEAARSRGVQTLYLFTLDKQAWYSRQGWTVLAPCVWHERPGEIMSKRL